MKACLYARYSTEMQSEASIDDQLRVTERLAKQHGFEVIAHFSDAAISGGTATRPGYQAMLEAARRREFDVIVAEDTSRLWRNLAEQAPRLAELADLGVDVITHDLDTRSESAGILGAVLGASSEAYRKEIARRTRRGLEGLARNGKPTGGRAYGYVSAAESCTGQVEIDQEKADLVHRIFKLYAEGMSPRAIAALLNEERVPSPGSDRARTSNLTKSWVMSAIAGSVRDGLGILNNEIYIGRVIWNRFKWVRSAADSSRRRRLPNPKGEWVIRDRGAAADHPPTTLGSRKGAAAAADGHYRGASKARSQSELGQVDGTWTEVPVQRSPKVRTLRIELHRRQCPKLRVCELRERSGRARTTHTCHGASSNQGFSRASSATSWRLRSRPKSAAGQ